MATVKKVDIDVNAEAGTSVAVANIDFSADAGVGLEGVGAADMAVPFIIVLQANSPQLDGNDSLRPGMLYNSITGEFGREALIIPCAYKRSFIRWADRATGGGFKGELSPMEVEHGQFPKDPTGQYVPGDGDKLADTRTHIVLVSFDNGAKYSPAILSLTSTQIKASKRFMALIAGLEVVSSDGRTYTPPSFAGVYQITTEKQENTKGSWYGVKIQAFATVSDMTTYNRAKELNHSFKGGGLEVKHAPEDGATTGDGWL